MQTAILFPGQGSQTPGMRDRAAALRPDLVALATECVGEDPFPRADEDTRFAQPAILVASLANWGELGEYRPPAAVAGHSLGELTALAAARVISERDAVRLAAVRGRLMSACGRGLDARRARWGQRRGRRASPPTTASSSPTTTRRASSCCPGARDGLARAGNALRDAGVRVIELNVSGAFHSPFMAGAVPEWTDALHADLHPRAARPRLLVRDGRADRRRPRAASPRR